jgi:hypothetical protein
VYVLKAMHLRAVCRLGESAQDLGRLLQGPLDTGRTVTGTAGGQMDSMMSGDSLTDLVDSPLLRCPFTERQKDMRVTVDLTDQGRCPYLGTCLNGSGNEVISCGSSTGTVRDPRSHDKTDEPPSDGRETSEITTTNDIR